MDASAVCQLGNVPNAAETKESALYRDSIQAFWGPISYIEGANLTAPSGPRFGEKKRNTKCGLESRYFTMCCCECMEIPQGIVNLVLITGNSKTNRKF